MRKLQDKKMRDERESTGVEEIQEGTNDATREGRISLQITHPKFANKIFGDFNSLQF